MAIAMMEATANKGNRSAMVLDRIALCNQTSARLEKYDIDHGVLQSGHWRYRPDRPIQVCSAQTLEKRGDFPAIDLLVVDECHCSRKDTINFIQNAPEKVRTIGLSASPFTKGLGATYDCVVSTVTTKWLVENKYLAPLRVFIAKEIDMKGAKKVAGEWSQAEATERGIKITGDIVTEWVKKTHEIFGKPEKTIVFCAGVAHGEDLSRKFAEAGYNFVSISYKDDDEFKRQVIEDFSKPDTSINGLIATDILTKGFDCADVRIGVSARPFSKSFSSHVQQMGRVMRACHGKDFAVWLDHAGNFIRFRDKWESLYADGVQKLDDGFEKTAKEPTDKEKEKAKCPICGAIWPGKSDTCLHCGHTRQRSSQVIDVPGELKELGGAKAEKYSSEQKQKWYSMFLYRAHEKGYKSGWVSNQYLEKFGVWPRGMAETPTQPDSAVSSWIISQNIRFAKARKK